MRKTFIEAGEFTEWVTEYLTDEQPAGLQRELLNDPQAGAVIPGCGGLRKMRVADPKRGKGKRGGVRVVYLHVEEADQIHLIAVYGKEKDQKDDPSADDKAFYWRLVLVINDQARRSRGRESR
jgi:hypothetical protein